MDVMDIEDARRIVIELARSAMADEDEEPEAHAQHFQAIEAVEGLEIGSTSSATPGSSIDIADALQIVIDLAQSVIAEKDEEPQAHAEHSEAIAVVEDMAVNQFGDD